MSDMGARPWLPKYFKYLKLFTGKLSRFFNNKSVRNFLDFEKCTGIVNKTDKMIFLTGELRRVSQAWSEHNCFY